jgi:hypothetical protein
MSFIISRNAGESYALCISTYPEEKYGFGEKLTLYSFSEEGLEKSQI